MTQARAASEPLLWLQLLGLGLLPLESLLVLLLLAGSDPGPFPALERLLCWAIGGLGTALLLWRRPADVWSLLLVQTPARGRRELQRRLSALQETPALKAGLVLGAALLLVLLWRLDGAAALATALAPLPEAPRLVDLLLSAPLLALMLWQWQQSLQALWLLSRSAAAVAAAPPLESAALAERRLSVGLPLLLPAPLAAAPRSVAAQNAPRSAAVGTPAPRPAQAPAEPPEPPEGPPGVEMNEDSAEQPEASAPAQPAAETEAPTSVATTSSEVAGEPADRADRAEPGEPGAPSGAEPPVREASVPGLAVAVEPEQGTEQADGPELDQPVG